MKELMNPQKKAEWLQRIDNEIAAGPYTLDWASLQAYRVPDWYTRGRFGIFIHWGVYSVPAFGSEWYPYQMYRKDSDTYKHHVDTYGPHTQFGYKDFIPQFTSDQFDPADWAALFKAAGARFVVPVAEHHDGFAMYDTDLNPWNAHKMGPRRNVIGELADAVRGEGMVFGASSHRAEHFFFMGGGMEFDSDVSDPEYYDFYGPAQPQAENWHDLTSCSPTEAYMQDWLVRTCEMVERYQPQLVWFDWWIQNLAWKPYILQFAVFYYNRAAAWGKPVAINYKYQAYDEGTAVFDIERGQLAGPRAMLWQNDTSIATNTWGYVDDMHYKEADGLLADLADIVSKNGALLLNVCPDKHGVIHDEERAILLHMGDWLARSGEAIYDVDTWKIHGEGPTQVADGAFTDTNRVPFTKDDIRYTCKGSTVYATVLGWPKDGKVTLPALGIRAGLCDQVLSVEAVEGHKLTWERLADGLHVQVQRPATGSPVVLRVRT